MAEAPFIAEIELSHPDLALTDTIEAHPELQIELDYQIIADPETYYLFFEVAGDDFDATDEDFEAFEESLAADPTVDESTVIIAGGEFRVYRMRLLALDHLVLPRAAELGMRILHAEAGSTGGWAATLEVPRAELLKQFREHCTDRDVGFVVNRLYRQDVDGAGGEFALTPAQRDALVAAFRAGYFEEPRGASLEDVAEELAISSSAASGRIRRAVATLLANTVLAEES